MYRCVVWISNAREMIIGSQDVNCVGACPPVLQDQYFGSCFKNDDCLNSCFESCKFLRCVNHECICGHLTQNIIISSSS
ncbi:hypothetical protein EUTSA_v10023921mg [Eutrema salsugineum]|uniref:Uncharacterized protein n=1 Tax=Eutrema salsugineum TaxID=72664 RepID=V4KCT0_EUTSA|nr:hypothetical protein EUTSA_v10023921mg [Eutrema salsugineum]